MSRSQFPPQSKTVACRDGSRSPSSLLIPANTVTQSAEGSSVIGDGQLNLAGRDVLIHNHYCASHSGADETARVISALQAVRNLRKAHQDTLAKATSGTGLWLFTMDQWLFWLDLNGRINVLWGTGIPGAGKSVLASIVINELEAHAANAQGTICVAYVLIRYSDTIDATIRGFLEVLVKQTVERHSDCAAIVAPVYARHKAEDTQPSEAELLQLLKWCIEAKNMTFYIVDALDEAPDRLQLDLVRKLAGLGARLFITSRPLRTVETRAPEAHRFTIAAQDHDLDLHIEEGISRSPDLEELLERDPTLRSEVASSIKRNCGGMFLHASLQLDELCQSVSLQDIRNTLDSFPLKIEDVYLRTWKRIQDQGSRLAALAEAFLVWVVNASKSLKLEALERMVAVPFTTCKFEPARVVAGATLLGLCRGLVVFEEESRIARLVHYTAQDTLRRVLMKSFPHPQSLLATVCMTYLVDCGFQNTTIASDEEFDEVLRNDPLLAYASKEWAFHAHKSLDIDDMRHRTASFIAGCHAFPAFIHPDNDIDFDILGPIHILSKYNFPLSLLGHNSGDPNADTHIGGFTPLIIASWHGHSTFVRNILKLSDIQPNLMDFGGWTALDFATLSGAEVTSLLLSHPDTRINLRGPGGRSTLSTVIMGGHEPIAALLLVQPGLDVNSTDNGDTPLTLAVRRHQEGIVRLLLADPRVNVNAGGSLHRTALHDAAVDGHKGMVELLLVRRDLDVNLVDGSGNTALQHAAERGNEAVVRLLLDDPRLDIQAEHDRGKEASAAIIAQNEGPEAFVKLLGDYQEVWLAQQAEKWEAFKQSVATDGTLKEKEDEQEDGEISTSEDEEVFEDAEESFKP